MNTPVTVAVLAFPEATASVVYGMYDLFMSAGRDWGIVVEGQPGPSLMQPLVVSAQAAAFRASNDVLIAPQQTLEACPRPDIVCISEIAVPPGAPLEGR